MSRDLSISELVQRAYARAVPPKKLVKLIQARLANEALPVAEDDLAAALLPPLLVSSPPSLLLSYLSQCLSSGLITCRTAVTQLLFHDLPPPPTLNILASILALNLSGLEDGVVIPSFLPDPTAQHLQRSIPAVGTSKSATPPPVSQSSTLALLLPFLRICASASTTPSLVTLIGRVISLLSPFPAPSLDIGLAAGQLLPSLAEEIAAPLRTCLSGLMADLATQDLPPIANGSDGMDVQMDGGATGDQTGRAEVNTALPLPQTIAFLLDNARRSHRFERSTADVTDLISRRLPSKSYINLLKIGPYLTLDPSIFVSSLIEAALHSAMNQSIAAPSENVETWADVVETLPRLLRWWKEHSDEKWPFPTDLAPIMGSIFQNSQIQLAASSEIATQTYSALVLQAEAEDEAAGFSPPEGWQLLSITETLIDRLAHLGLITPDEARAIVPAATIQAPSPGESLINRLSNAMISQLPPLAHIIDYAHGASSFFADELVKVIKTAPSVMPPDNLFIHIASQPQVLSALSAHIPPLILSDLLVTRLLDASVDDAARADDPQGSLTRFGEGVVLVEAVVAHFQLPIPDLLRDSRRAISFTHLSATQKSCMNGWVKAVFGSDGIEDEILLATPPQDLCKLASSLISQAIAATTAGQIDLDTLHGGLSYFSQPLLSWCLGGVISWLCREIERQGLLSALHLIVLQDLLLSNACPEALIRINARHINALLDPSGGLGAVFESSSFDALAVRAKLDSLGLLSSPDIPPAPLGSALPIINGLDLAVSGWEKPFSSSIQAALDGIHGAANGVKVIMDEVISPLPASGGNGKLIKFAPLLFVLFPTETGPTVVETIVRSYIPDWIEDSQLHDVGPAQVQVEAVLDVLKNTLRLLADIDPDNAQATAVELSEELGHSWPVIEQNTGTKRKHLFAATKEGRRTLTNRLRDGLRDDEDLRVRFGGVFD